MIGSVLDVFRLRQYFKVITGVREVGAHLREDVGFLNTVRRAVVTLPFEAHTVDTRPLPPRRRLTAAPLGDRRLGFAATGAAGRSPPWSGAPAPGRRRGSFRR